MKLTKKLLSLFLTLAMLAVMAVPAFAAGEGSIKIDNAVKGHTYTAYQILSLESFKDDAPDDNTEGLYSYKVTSEWKSFVESAEINGVYLDVNAQGGVTWHENADASAFAALAIAHAEANKATITGKSVTATGEEVTIPDLDLGYYLVDTSLGSLCSLGTTDKVAEISEKNQEPGIKKEYRMEDAVAGIGQQVNYTITVTAQKDAKNYVVHDKMTAGLTFDNNVSIEGLTLGTDYTVEAGTLADGCTFHIVFTENYLNTIESTKDIVITYSATINEKAVEIEEVNPLLNVAKLVYGDNVTTEWTDGSTTTNTLKFTLNKVDGSNAPLDGAEFELWDATTGGNKINLVVLNVGTNKYRVATAEEVATEGFTSAIIKAGTAIIEGLNDGKYYLEETKAPDGYNQLTARKEVNLTGITEVANAPTVTITNLSGTELPSTGGMGTTLFYLGGGAMFLGALVMLVTKKRMKD